MRGKVALSQAGARDHTDVLFKYKRLCQRHAERDRGEWFVLQQASHGLAGPGESTAPGDRTSTHIKDRHGCVCRAMTQIELDRDRNGAEAYHNQNPDGETRYEIHHADSIHVSWRSRLR